MNDYLPNKQCAICKGECCKNLPAPYTPNDIIRIFGSVENAVKSGEVAIDWWEASPPLYFMRPKIKGVEKLYHPAWRGECIHLTNKGCRLPRNKQPSYCKYLEPRKSAKDRCNPHNKKENSKYTSAMEFKKAKIDLECFRY